MSAPYPIRRADTLGLSPARSGLWCGTCRWYELLPGAVFDRCPRCGEIDLRIRTGILCPSCGASTPFDGPTCRTCVACRSRLPVTW